MAKLKVHSPGYVFFYCPGCKHTHCMNIDESKGRPAWKFDGNFESPTITPSFLETSGHYVTGQPQPPNCDLCNRTAEEEKYNYACGRCHLFLTKGQIIFLSDCTHALAGKTVPLSEVDDGQNSNQTEA